MTQKSNPLEKKILKIINASDRPLATNEIAAKLGVVTWDKAVTLLRDLRGDGKIAGHKFNAGGQGLWVWWRKDAFRK